ncbi:aspartate/glutamate racemase family protein [Arthrobacter sp. NicSoilB8]|uniref:aspartate/glutamate racemase family protein n=1 Tax=Arthrobacter sp. NicSoilB8 TaxID=2830998 RepID=UPI001CC40A6C|nr:aspartate/glutamate racemase family protein [Arthrobacter sp. NicSoilB8]BCW71581.1 hydantoin racemase [Arthrobacter sp. NicSoilB8]
MRVGLIRVMTTSDRRLLNAHGRILQEAFGFTVTSRCIPDQPSGVYDQASLAAAAPKVALLAREMAGDADALIISCASDPGLAATRAAVDIPVIGAGSAAAAAAQTFGGRIGVLGLGAHVPGPISDALGERMLLIDGVGHVETPDAFLMPTGIFDTLAAAHMLVDAGADVIVQASTGLSSIGMAEVLRRRLGIPVIDAVTAAGSMLVSAVLARELQEV